MKKVISILFLLSMLAQAIPVLHFFTDKPETFYAVIDEEKPVEKSKEVKEDKQDDKAFFSYCNSFIIEKISAIRFHTYASQLPSSPHPEMLTPPPDFC